MSVLLRAVGPLAGGTGTWAFYSVAGSWAAAAYLAGIVAGAGIALAVLVREQLDARRRRR